MMFLSSGGPYGYSDYQPANQGWGFWLPPAPHQHNVQHNPAIPSYLASNHWNVPFPRDAMLQPSDKNNEIRREGELE
jgi:hypothetical protein